MDIQAACTGFLYALSITKAFIEAGHYRHVLIIATEKMSAFINYKDRATCVLFGDGAAAAVIANQGEGFLINTLHLGSDGNLADLVKIPAGGSRYPATKATIEQGLHFFQMSGKEVFKHAVRQMGAAIHECLLKANLDESNISWLVPHQANKRIIDAIAKNINLPEGRVYQTVHKYGNTSASSVAIALHELTKEQKIGAGEHLLLTAFGGGLTWGAAF